MKHKAGITNKILAVAALIVAAWILTVVILFRVTASDPEAQTLSSETLTTIQL